MTTPNKCASASIAAGMALALTAGTSGVAAAKDVTVVAAAPGESLSERVSYADLDLATRTGVQILNSRVGGAVYRVCSPLDQRSTFSEHASCRSFAWNGARPQMNQAVARAQQIAAVGTSSIAPAAILIVAPQR
jgi:UrcA family protein